MMRVVRMVSSSLLFSLLSRADHTKYMALFEAVVVRDFVGNFLSWMEPTWVNLDKQVIWFSTKNSFRGEVRAISDSALTITARSQKIKIAEIRN